MVNTLITRDSFYIDGGWSVPSSDARGDVVNPATEQVMGHAPCAAPSDIDRAVAAARQAFDEGDWPHMPPEERIGRVEAAMAHMAARVDEIAGLVTDEMGAPIWMRGHFDWAQTYWADIRDSYRAFPLDSLREHAQGRTVVAHEPVGVVAGIVPWNGPLLMAIEKMASALITGCTCVLKPSPETPLDAYFIAEALDAVGVPPGVFNLVPGGREAGEYLVSHRGVDKVSLTGSTVAGRRVAAICGGDLRRASLELGGKSAAVVLEDAPVELVAQALRWGNFISTGQACNLLSRVVVPRSRRDEFVAALVANAEGLRIGDPRDPATELGPLAMARQRDKVENHIAQAQADGARLVVGGRRPPHLSRGFFIEPTIFTDVTPDMALAREEVFGPVVAVLCYDDEAEALTIANDSDYGLHGAVFAADDDRALAFARRMRTGSVGINRYGQAPNAPFGGYKASGMGRVHGPEGIAEHLNVKSLAFR